MFYVGSSCRSKLNVDPKCSEFIFWIWIISDQCQVCNFWVSCPTMCGIAAPGFLGWNIIQFFWGGGVEFWDRHKPDNPDIGAGHSCWFLISRQLAELSVVVFFWISWLEWYKVGTTLWWPYFFLEDKEFRKCLWGTTASCCSFWLATCRKVLFFSPSCYLILALNWFLEVVTDWINGGQT